MPPAKLIGRSLRSALLVIVVVGGTGLDPAPTAQALSSAQAARPSGQWSMFMNGPLRRGRTPIVGAQSSHLAWGIPTETNGGGPVIGRDGTIYQGTDFGQLLALTPDGATKWAISVPYRVNSAPAILPDGRIAFVDEGGTIYVVNSDGSPSWRFYTGTAFGSPNTAPAIGRDGTMYTGIWQTVYALHPDGSIRWTYDVGRLITGPVAVRPDGVVYLPAGYLFAFQPDGTLLWQWAPPSSGVGGAPSIGSDGTIYVDTYGGLACAVNPNGTTKWTYPAGPGGADVPPSPAIAIDGTIYFAEFGSILAFAPDGTVKWQYDTTDSDPTSPSVGGDGTIYVGETPPYPRPAGVWALNADGTLKWEYDDPDAGYVRTPPAIGRGHRVYAGSVSGFFAIGP